MSHPSPDSSTLVPISYRITDITDTPDIPVGLKGFERNILKCKICFGLSGLLGILSEVVFDTDVNRRRSAWGTASLGLQMSSLCILLVSLMISPVSVSLEQRRRRSTANFARAVTSHQSVCIMLTILSLASLSTSLVHCYLSGVLFYGSVTSRHAALLLPLFSSIMAFLSSGLMRRGPRLYHHVPAIQLGSGLRATVEDDDEGLQRWLAGEGGVEPEGNVLDYDGCGVLSLMLGSYFSPLWHRSWTKPQLNESDLLQLPSRHRSAGVANSDSALEERGHGSRHASQFVEPHTNFSPWGLLFYVWRGSGSIIAWGMFLTGISELLDLIPKIMDREIIRLFETGAIKTSKGQRWGYLMCFGAAGLRLLSFIITNYSDFLENYHLHGRVRMKMEQMLYAKLLRSYDPRYVVDEKLDTGGPQITRKSQLVTLFGNDVNEVSSFAMHMCYHSVRVVVGFGLPFAYACHILGWSAVASLAVLVALTPLVRYCSGYVFRMSRRIPLKRDKRVSIVREMLQSITAVKLNAWDERFMRKASISRAEELQAIRTSKLASAVLSTCDRWVPMIAIWLAFVTHTVIRQKPDFPASTALILPKVFGGAFQNLLKGPRVLARAFTLYISCGRIATYLNALELQNRRATQNTTKLCNVTATWQGEANARDGKPSFHLKDVSVTFIENTLNIVTGPLGSGKSALLLTILGETRVLHGEVVAPRSVPATLPSLGTESDVDVDPSTKADWLQPSIAYTPQVAYIEHGTVRSNICFGQVFWKDRYNEVVRACCLEEDIGSWPDADMTELGEGGYVISGGQQSRINLARSLYSRAQTLLIDDPLSAVDNTTARHLIELALTGPLVAHRTVILATHSVALCSPVASQLVVLQEGRVDKVLDTSNLATDLRIADPTSESNRVRGPSKEVVDPPFVNPRQLIEPEKREAGLSGRRHFISLLKTAGGVRVWLPVLAIAIFNDAIGIGHSALLARWSSPVKQHTDLFYAIASISITITRGLGMFCLSAILIYAFTWRASGSVHGALLAALLRAPLQVLQAIPTGRILNRFTQDMERFDMDLEGITHQTIKMSAGLTLVLLCTVKEVPQLSLVLLALVPIFYSLQWRLAKLLSDAKKLNSIWSSPMLTMVNDSEYAATVIRAFGAVGSSNRKMRVLQTQKRIAGMTEFAAWLLCRCSLQGVGLLIPLTTGISILHRPEQSAGWAGYTFSIVQAVTLSLYELIMQVGEIDVALVTVERLAEYSQLPSEPEAKSPKAVSASWPSAGHLQIEKLSASYDFDLPDVLHDVTFEVYPSERVGVVGRTGNGKSTLALCLLRALQVMKGNILIDGEDIMQLELRELRSRISFIPQEAVLTSGTLRQALDINEEHTDAELYEVLKCVHLAGEQGFESRSERFSDLDQMITSGGGNMSRGERQLIALARALLKRSRLLVMDEATSSIDQEMDEKIRHTIKHSFQGVTMLVIAHRLATVVDFDKVLVMKEGRAAEYDRPRTLLQNPDSEFYKLCGTHGTEELDMLKRLAGL